MRKTLLGDPDDVDPDDVDRDDVGVARRLLAEVADQQPEGEEL